MNPINDFDTSDGRPIELGEDGDFSVEDFLKQLEARERDLHISPDLDIEIEDGGFDEVPEFILEDLEAETTRAVEPHFRVPADTAQAAEIQRLEMQVTALQAELVRKEAVRHETAEMLKRRQTDFENLKKRVEREKEDMHVDGICSLVTSLLPVLDNLNHALDFAGPVVGGRSQEFVQFYEGIALVGKQINEVLAELGAEEIRAVGEPFDPGVHEAVAVEESADFSANSVMEELRRGYRVGDRVIRAAMVKVASAPREESFSTVGGAESPDYDILDLGDEGPSNGN